MNRLIIKKTEEFINIDFKLADDNFSIMGYYSLKSKLGNAYDKLVKINKGLKLIGKRCNLVIDTSGY